MAKLMVKYPILAEVLKQCLIAALTTYYIINFENILLKLLCIILGLVVAHNTYSIIISLALQKKVKSPLFKLTAALRIPEKYAYLPIVVFLFATAFGILQLIK
ncbi:hypothetical protein ES704_01964 [subsurface metagenome]|jgi:TRAP-type C4-dicarboxylate transport system permease small subunit